jgi:hypothetical protein
MENLVQMNYFANSNPIGTGTNFPFGILWNPDQQGRYTLLAQAIDRTGSATWSRPVTVTIGPSFAVGGPIALTGGELLLFYDAIPLKTAFYLGASETADFSTNVLLAPVAIPGVFVDEGASSLKQRFYAIVPGP